MSKHDLTIKVKTWKGGRFHIKVLHKFHTTKGNILKRWTKPNNKQRISRQK